VSPDIDYGFQAIEQCIAKPFELEDFVSGGLLRERSRAGVSMLVCIKEER